MSEPLVSELRDRVALVTGASGGIGGALAEALADRGARLILVGRDAARLAALAERLRGRSPEIDVQPTDLADDTALRRMASRVGTAFGGVDLLAHVAGAFAAGTVEAAPVADLDLQLAVNLRAPYLLTQLLLPGLRARKGQIVFMSSSAGLTPRASVSAYAASKAAFTALASALREEVNRDGVRVLTVYPGRTASRMQEQVRTFEGKTYEPERFVQPEDVAKATVAALELPRTAELTELHLRPMQPLI